MIKTPVLSEVEDQKLRKIFQDLFFNINNENIIRADFKFLTFELLKAETLLKVPHNIGYAPLDLIQTSSIGAGVMTYHYNLFDNQNIVVSSTGAVTVRLLLGRYT